MRMSFDQLFQRTAAVGMISPRVPVQIGGDTMTPGVAFGGGVNIDGVDLIQLVGKDFEVEVQDVVADEAVDVGGQLPEGREYLGLIAGEHGFGGCVPLLPDVADAQDSAEVTLQRRFPELPLDGIWFFVGFPLSDRFGL